MSQRQRVLQRPLLAQRYLCVSSSKGAESARTLRLPGQHDNLRPDRHRAVLRPGHPGVLRVWLRSVLLYWELLHEHVFGVCDLLPAGFHVLRIHHVPGLSRLLPVRYELLARRDRLPLRVNTVT